MALYPNADCDTHLGDWVVPRFSNWPVVLLVVLGVILEGVRTARAQSSPSVPEVESAKIVPPGTVEVAPNAQDQDIRRRLIDILEATGWFSNVRVTVQEGIVFLKGEAADEPSKKWAGDLGRKTEGVVAVVNQMEVATPSIWNFAFAREQLEDLARSLMRGLPLLLMAVIVLMLAWALARLTVSMSRRALRPKIPSQLLREVTARIFGIVILLLGLYLVLRVSGLTRLAVTVIGGTGLIGLVLGIAFRDITENFLASLFLSLQRPFREGDLVEVSGVTGYVQRLTSRTTVLMALDGNQVQVPNATVFKSTIRNFTSNPNRRGDFVVGIGYRDPIPQAQELALKVLADHPALLKEPEPWVLVDNLSPATVNLRVYFWLDGRRHSWLKVKSSVIRLVKRAFQDAGISLPDEAREVVFPDGVPVRMLDADTTAAAGDTSAGARNPGISATSRKREPEAVSTAAEAGLQSEAAEIEQQARQSWSPDQGENLLAAQ